jgi:hypothetical protein
MNNTKEIREDRQDFRSLSLALSIHMRFYVMFHLMITTQLDRVSQYK